MSRPAEVSKPVLPLRQKRVVTMSTKKCGLVLLLAALVAVGFTGNAQATLIVGDDFSTINGGDGPITGRTPDLANLPGATWILPSTGVFPEAFTISATAGYGNPAPGAVSLNGQISSAISLASSGTYVKPTVFTIVADLSPFNTLGPASGGRGLGIGFYSGIGSSYSNNFFTGLILDQNGNLNLVNDPNSSGFFSTGSYTGTPVAYAGTWDNSAYHTLSYQVDTTTGHISHISLGGSTANYTAFESAAFFTDAATKYAGMYKSALGAGWGRIDNFAVSSVPEPSTIVLLVTGLIGLLAYAWRKRKS
jgi:hypothetical protein